MEVLGIVTLALNIWACSGFPVYDYDPAVMREALEASVAKVNAQSQSPNLFRAYKSSVKRVNFMNENDLSMDIDFRIRETECRKESGNPPSTCDFKRGYYVPTASCRSTIQISAEQVQNVWVRCHPAFSSSDSSSSEEIFGSRLGLSNWRSYYMRDTDSNESRSEPLYQRSMGIRDVRLFPARSRRRQDYRNRYNLFE
ncbi:secreted phosphoprotein 24 [Gracilinanus agilis]|uniref:secreted phosphoprotein 24 n=1 Tax=Gracilinanus agilis TaxID=191870 RepID=UPI001CFF0616|nr:secreted phosphoprotein 24 [Gracilinanus agilis]XP_044532518.1 secreted phosphoprotein 24 [Gracilinanus agilis]